MREDVPRSLGVEGACCGCQQMVQMKSGSPVVSAVVRILVARGVDLGKGELRAESCIAGICAGGTGSLEGSAEAFDMDWDDAVIRDWKL